MQRPIVERDGAAGRLSMGACTGLESAAVRLGSSTATDASKLASGSSGSVVAAARAISTPKSTSTALPFSPWSASTPRTSR